MNRVIKIKVGDTGIEVPIPVKPIQSFDTAAMSFMVGQLTAFSAKIYEARYPDIFYHEIVPVNTEYPEWATEASYRSFDGVTMAKFIGSAADDLPTVALSANITMIPVALGGIAADWTLDELMKSQALGYPVDSKKLEKAFRGYQEHAQNVVLFGDKDRSMGGLLDYANITTATVSEKVFDEMTGDSYQAVQDALNKPLKTVWETSKGVFTPDTLLIPSHIYTKISAQRMANGTDTSILEWFKKNNFYTSRTGQDLDIRPVFQLDDLGAAKKGRVVAYVNNIDCLEMPHPMPFKTLPPQYVNLSVKVPTMYKFGGIDFKQPISACYVDITA